MAFQITRNVKGFGTLGANVRFFSRVRQTVGVKLTWPREPLAADWARVPLYFLLSRLVPLQLLLARQRQGRLDRRLPAIPSRS